MVESHKTVGSLCCEHTLINFNLALFKVRSFATASLRLQHVLSTHLTSLNPTDSVIRQHETSAFELLFQKHRRRKEH
jgi:hypothetical protein